MVGDSKVNVLDKVHTDCGNSMDSILLTNMEWSSAHCNHAFVHFFVKFLIIPAVTEVRLVVLGDNVPIKSLVRELRLVHQTDDIHDVALEEMVCRNDQFSEVIHSLFSIHAQPIIKLFCF